MGILMIFVVELSFGTFKETVKARAKSKAYIIIIILVLLILSLARVV